MNYKRIYEQLVLRAGGRELDAYTERHHIVPRCIGGADVAENLVNLTPEEHFIAHLLLVKIYPSEPKLVYAANMMHNRVANNKQYGWVKRLFAEVERASKSGCRRTLESRNKQSNTVKQKYADGYVSPCKGRSLSDEHKQKVREANRGKHVPVKARASLEGYIARYGPEEGPIRYAQDNTKKASMSLQAFIKRFGPLEGPIQYEAHRAEKSSRMTGECHPLYGKGHTEETKRKISNAKTGKKLERTAEHNAKIAAAMAGRKPLQDTCEHCGLTTSTTNIKRWHNDKCKHR